MIRRNTCIGRKQARNEDELQPKFLYRSIRIQNIVKTVVSLFSVFSEALSFLLERRQLGRRNFAWVPK